jgi:lipoprotein signal peptidase
MRLRKVSWLALFVVFFVGLHFWLRSWIAMAHITGSVCNQNGPLGIFLPKWLFIYVSLAILAFLVTQYRKSQTFSAQWPWLLILSGGLGNLLERLSFGCIMDYIALPFFPVFNIADILLTIGVIGVLMKNVKIPARSTDGKIKNDSF